MHSVGRPKLWQNEFGSNCGYEVLWPGAQERCRIRPQKCLTVSNSGVGALLREAAASGDNRLVQEMLKLQSAAHVPRTAPHPGEGHGLQKKSTSRWSRRSAVNARSSTISL